MSNSFFELFWYYMKLRSTLAEIKFSLIRQNHLPVLLIMIGQVIA